MSRFEARIPDGVDTGSALIIKCVETGLNTLGETGQTATLHFIKSKYGLDRSEIPGNPGKFIEAIRGLFGFGGIMLLHSIADELRKLSSQDEREKTLIVTFVDELDEAADSISNGVA